MSVKFSHVQLPSLSSLYFKDDRVLDIGADYSPLRGPKRYMWSRQEKEILYLLNDFDNPSAELQKIFHAYFAKKYASGFKPRKAAWQSMSTYIAYEVRHGKRPHRRVSRETRAKLANVARLVGIQLIPKPHAGSVVKSRLPRKAKLPGPALGTTTASENDWSSEGSEYFEDTHNQSLANKSTPRIPLGGLLTPPSTNQKKRSVSDS